MDEKALPTATDLFPGQPSTSREPQGERAVRLRSKMSPERWEREVEDAQWRLRVVRHVERRGCKQHGVRAARLREIAPDVPWPTFCYWRHLVAVREGPEWERLLDTRIPPPVPKIDPEVKRAAARLRRVDPTMPPEEARRHLIEDFGKRGNLSDPSLYRTWRSENLTNPEAGDPRRFERVVRYSGGAALALIGAAAAESGVPEALAQAALRAGRDRADEQSEPPPADPHPGRDQGRFTAAYNQAVRQGVEGGKRDARWDPEAAKRDRRDLGAMSVLALAPETLGQRLLTMGMVPLVTSQRGFDGMDAPRAHWLKVLGWRAYRPATLDKTLAELGTLGVDEVVWDAHGELWSEKAREWAQDGPAWLALARYLDITADPHWTRYFARSGKVSRTGRVQPCLQRAMLTAGPGIPLWASTVAGTQDLKKIIERMLEDEVNGGPAEEKGELQRITVIDAEGAVPALLTKMAALPHHRFVTVIKGQTLKGAAITEQGLWLPYRGRDLVCEAQVVLRSGLKLRGVIMERPGTRSSQRTLFVTDALATELETTEVADVYLSRWPNQEGIFRGARHGAGLEHSQGFSGEFVTHVALAKKQDTAKKRVERTERELKAARSHTVDTEILKMVTEDPQLGEVAVKAAKQAGQKAREAEKRHQAAVEEKQHQDSVPEKIFQRDTTRENIATALKLSIMLLAEWVLREYFGGLMKIELETFLNYFLYLPVEVRTSWHKVHHRIDTTDLASGKKEWLHKACLTINQRDIRRFGRKLTFEVWERPDDGST